MKGRGDDLLVWINWALLVGSIIGWVTTLLWLAKDEPPWVLSLSWAAITYTAGTALIAAYVKRNQ